MLKVAQKWNLKFLETPNFTNQTMKLGTNYYLHNLWCINVSSALSMSYRKKYEGSNINGKTHLFPI